MRGVVARRVIGRRRSVSRSSRVVSLGVVEAYHGRIRTSGSEGARTPDVAVVTPLNNFLGPEGDTVTAHNCSTKH